MSKCTYFSYCNKVYDELVFYFTATLSKCSCRCMLVSIVNAFSLMLVLAFWFVLQYPLKEVVVIHQDPEALKDIESLQKYILEVSKLKKVNRTPNHSNIYIVLCIHIAFFCFVFW